MEKCALDLLAIADGFVETCLASGLKLVEQAEPHYKNFKRLHDLLRRTPRVEEGEGKPASSQICLETLGSE
jgi:hypothetical protein